MHRRGHSQLDPTAPSPRAPALPPRAASPSSSPPQSGTAAVGDPAVREAEFRDIYESNFRLVWRALNRLGVREADLMDLTQKVFLTAYLKLPAFEGRSQLSTWLWGICRRVASGYRRSGAVRNEVATDPVSLELSAEEQGAVSGEQDYTRELVEAILSKLSEPQRIVFTLFEVDELDGREIAALLNISIGTVRSRLRYARKLFRREVRRQALANAFPR